MPPTLLVSTRKGLFTYRDAGGRLSIAESAFLGDPVTISLHDQRDGATYAALRLGHFGCKLHRQERDRTWREVASPAYPEKPADAVVVRDPMRGEEVPWKVDQIWALAVDYGQDGALWCGTIPGGLFHSTDRGETWTLNTPLWNLPARAKWFGGGYDWPGIHSILTHPSQPDRVTVGVSCGGAWRSHDRGQTWVNASRGMRAAFMPEGQEFDPEIQDPHLVAQCATRPDMLWAQHHNGIFRSSNDGDDWREITTAVPSSFGFATAVHPHDPETAWFVPAIKDERRIPVDGRFVVTRTRDGGASFEVLGEGLPDAEAFHLVYRHALAVSPADADPARVQLAIGSTTGSLWHSADQGDHWSHVSAHLPPIYAVMWA